MDARSDEEVPRPSPRPTLGQWVTRTVVWIGPRRIAGSLVMAAAAGVGGWWLLHAPPPPVERSLPTTSRTTVAALPGGTQAPVAGTATTAVAPAGVPVVVVAHVAGAVKAPGLVRLPAAARVADAVTAAGGPSATADLDALNLAAPVVDGSRIYVPEMGEVVPPVVGGSTGSPPGSAGSSPSVSGPLDINLASAEQFDTLPGVGPATAQAIVSHREEHGPFRAVDDLLDVRGIGPGKLEQFRALVTV